MLSKFEAYTVALELYQECEKLPMNRILRDQLSRASLSICLNLAEGSAKPGMKEKRRFYAIAFGSCREVQALLGILGSPEPETKKSDRLGAMLYRLVYPRTGP